MTKRRIISVLSVLLLIVGLASAYATLVVAPLTQNAVIGGAAVPYTLTLVTDETGAKSLTWMTSDPSIIAVIGPVGGPYAAYGQSGNYNFVIPAGGCPSATPCTFDLKVKATAGATVGQQYDVTSWYGTLPFTIKAVATGSVVPIPEVSTVILTSAGLIGLIGLVIFRRKD